jgi:hypothetical protein
MQKNCKVNVRQACLRMALLLGLSCMAALPVRAQSGDPEPDNSEAASYKVIRAALQLRDVSLRVHKTCINTGPIAPARTVGDYLAGYMAHMHSKGSSISTNCQSTRGGSRCELWMKHADGEDHWAWGISFEMDARGKANPSSVQCVGAG